MIVGCVSNGGDDDNDDGTRTQEIQLSEVPAAVTQGFQRDFPGATIEEVERETYPDGTIHYEFEYKDSAGKEHDVEYNASGEQLDEH